MEMTVALGLMGIFIVMVSRTLWPFLKLTARGMARIEMQQQGLIALNRVRESLMQSAPEGVSLRGTSPFVLSVNRYWIGSGGELADINGSMRWRKDVDLFLFLEGEQTLKSRVWPPQASLDSPTPEMLTLIDSFVRPKKFSPDQLQTVAHDPAGSKTLATGVIGFSVTNSGPNGEIRLPIRLELRLQRGSDQMRVTRSVFVAGSTQ